MTKIMMWPQPMPMGDEESLIHTKPQLKSFEVDVMVWEGSCHTEVVICKAQCQASSSCNDNVKSLKIICIVRILSYSL